MTGVNWLYYKKNFHPDNHIFTEICNKRLKFNLLL